MSARAADRGLAAHPARRVVLIVSHDAAFELVMDVAAGGPEVAEIEERLHVIDNG